jgi:hypothetical protein
MSNTVNYQNNGSSQTFLGTSQNVDTYTSGSSARLAQAGLNTGATGILADLAGKVFGWDFRSVDGTVIPSEQDWRLRISMAPYVSQYFYNNIANAILLPLAETNGLIFPYTPRIQTTHNARYSPQQLTHTNYNSYSYEGSDVSSIQVSAEFTVQNIAEGQYLMAAIQFLRACTKMFFGQDVLAGSPPPMVFLDGYGATYLPHVPCVVTQFSHTMPQDVDYIKVPVGVVENGYTGQDYVSGSGYGSIVNLPTHCSLDITLQPVYSRNNISTNFTLEKYAGGRLNANGLSPIGGFL